ncbi:DgyrCDS7443 [Dimorphilus gyrociliatus]|uniref:DgyrCDS7443 n=1 Tax=Dimorphilus gyrociliatus TaxID=2664684 RepID=A0A7I8VR22_9ANNE|nr:DgyrCDS7443 [Dimorphilus gyrociliatus]
MLRLAVFSLILAAAYCKTPWVPCPDASKAGTPKNVVVPDCNSVPCKLKKGTDVSFAVEFESKETAANLTAVVHGILGSLPVPFPLSNPNACKDSGIQCPIKMNQKYKYNQKISISKSYPTISVKVKWELKDSAHKDLFCILVPVAIVD